MVPSKKNQQQMFCCIQFKSQNEFWVGDHSISYIEKWGGKPQPPLSVSELQVYKSVHSNLLIFYCDKNIVGSG